MNITPRCRGSKGEQARPPICAARRQAHRRAGCRGGQTNAALSARVRSNRPHGYRCRGSCSCRLCQGWRRTTSPRRRHFFLRVVGELGFHCISLERALLVEQGRRGRAEAVRAVVAAGASMQPMIRSALFSVLSDIGTPSKKTRSANSRIQLSNSLLACRRRSPAREVTKNVHTIATGRPGEPVAPFIFSGSIT